MILEKLKFSVWFGHKSLSCVHGCALSSVAPGESHRVGVKISWQSIFLHLSYSDCYDFWEWFYQTTFLWATWLEMQANPVALNPLRILFNCFQFGKLIKLGHSINGLMLLKLLLDLELWEDWVLQILWKSAVFYSWIVIYWFRLCTSEMILHSWDEANSPQLEKIIDGIRYEINLASAPVLPIIWDPDLS